MFSLVRFVMATHLLQIALIQETVADIAVCPGESARYGDHKCNHDSTHRVCAQLLGDDNQPKNWGTGDFWEITGQKAFQWDDQIRANHGDSWCICMWATARMIESVGCDNVHLRCEATSVEYVMKSYTDGGTDLASAKKCLAKKCPALAAATQRLSDATLPEVGSASPKRISGSTSSVSSGLVASLSVALLVSLGLIAMRRRVVSAAASPETNGMVE